MKTRRRSDVPDFTAQQLIDWAAEEEVLYASDSYSRKRLYCNLKGQYIVRVAGEEVWRGYDPFEATAKYHDITEKYIEPVYNLDLENGK